VLSHDDGVRVWVLGSVCVTAGSKREGSWGRGANCCFEWKSVSRGPQAPRYRSLQTVLGFEGVWWSSDAASGVILVAALSQTTDDQVVQLLSIGLGL